MSNLETFNFSDYNLSNDANGSTDASRNIDYINYNVVIN